MNNVELTNSSKTTHKSESTLSKAALQLKIDQLVDEYETLDKQMHTLLRSLEHTTETLPQVQELIEKGHAIWVRIWALKSNW